jgi:hypothetical protein
MLDKKKARLLLKFGTISAHHEWKRKNYVEPTISAAIRI